MRTTSINNLFKKLVDAQKNQDLNYFNVHLVTSRVLHNKWEMLNFDEENLLRGPFAQNKTKLKKNFASSEVSLCSGCCCGIL